ncbi:MAG TPA: hypothetical protein VMV36_05940 [Ignavibacteriaceae bacterium]|nr:hypothetical protein [Ignavibacteriaceae bacterium]
MNFVYDYRDQKHAENWRNGSKWNVDDDEKLSYLWKVGKMIAELSEIFGRSSGSIKTRLTKLNLLNAN